MHTSVLSHYCVCRGERTGGGLAGDGAFSLPDGPAVPVVFHLCLHPIPASSVPHLRPAGAQPLLPLWRQRGLHQCGVSIKRAR